MNALRIPIRPFLLALLVGLTSVPDGSAQWVTQTIQLQAGWNAVHLRVQPWPAACDQIFATLPVDRVSRYNARVISTQFGTDPIQLWKRPDEWLTWARNDGESGYVRTLENLVGGSAYLMHAAAPCTVSFQGRPVIARLEWVPGQPNLVGFQVSLSPELQPTFADFFRYEPAIDGDQQMGTNLIWQIGTNLESINLTAQTTRRKISPDLAYWVQAQKPSDYTGPLRVTTVNPDGLIFDRALDELTLTVRNVCDASAPPIVVTLRHVDSETPPTLAPRQLGAVPLLYADRTASNWVWRAWPTDQSQNWTLTNGQTLSLRLAVNRSAMPAPTQTNSLWQSILRLSGSSGTLVQIPLAADYAGGSDQLSPYPAGLWVGEARLSEASFVQFDTNTQREVATAPLPVNGSFPLRLILHAGTDGSCRLLSRAIVAALTDAGSNTVHHLYADAAGVPATARIVTRISSATFGHTGPVGLTGSGFLNALQGNYVVGHDDPLNPFKHIYHPGHNNLDTDGNPLPEGQESFTISNRVQLTWNAVPDPVFGATLWKPDETVTGTYQHEISNLRHTPIVLRGAFILKRVSRVGRLE